MTTIRGIYYWHAVVLGWGDIGYNYLVDPAGTVYEGRYGGDGAIGAHAFNSVSNINYNVGSIGIALLGCYEATDGACTTIDTITEAMQQSVVDLTAEKSSQFGFNPTGVSLWYGEDLPNVLTHRDLDATYCPGSGIYSLLDEIRNTAGNAFTNTRRYQAMYAGSDLADTYNLTDQPIITVQYTNVGRKLWKQEDVVMQVQLEETHERQQVTLTADVLTGTTVLLSSTLVLPDTPGDYTVTTRLYRHGQPVRGSKQSTAFTITNPYVVKVIATNLPTAIKTGWLPTLQLTIRNTGSMDLPAGTTLELNGEILWTTVQPWVVGQKKAISITLDEAASWPVGIQRLIFKMKVGETAVQQSRTVFVIRVDE